jgi:hypothetical protein
MDPNEGNARIARVYGAGPATAIKGAIRKPVELSLDRLYS